MGISSILNSKQREAVEYLEGPLLILAGAGSGKTRTITHRIAYLIDDVGIPSSKLFAATFTNKAADEMKERIHGLVKNQSDGLWIGTFHSTCVRILRNYLKEKNKSNYFAIYSASDQFHLIRECMKELVIDEKRFNPATFVSKISQSKNRLIGAEEYNKNVSDYLEGTIGRVYKLYQEKLRENNAFDFDDLIMESVLLLENDRAVREYYQEKFSHVLVDEYQDTNRAQYRLIMLITPKDKNICVVGDEDQSIYQWRGADINNILDFEKDFQNVKIIRLEENYRSTQTILNAANVLVKNNRERKGKNLWTKNKKGEKINYFLFETEHKEAEFIVQKVIEFHKEHKIPYSHFSVFYRTHVQSRVIEDILRQNNIFYTIVGGVRFYERKEIKDIVAYLRVIFNPHETISLKRIINVPRRGIGETTIEEIYNFLKDKKISFYDALKRSGEIPNISGRTREKIKEFISLMEKLQALKNECPSRILSEVLGATKYKEKVIQTDTVYSEEREESLEEFSSAIKQYELKNTDVSLGGFLQEISLVADIDTWNKNKESVTLMTFHNAKGLEFPIVFMTGMEEGIFPHFSSFASDKEMEEERRLCYVGITRARESLFLTAVKRRYLHGTEVMNPPSRFIKEIPCELINCETCSSGNESRIIPEVRIICGYKAGDIVEHLKWGQGFIKDIKGDGDDAKASIFFHSVGEKVLLLKLAPIKKIKDKNEC
ncbi:MAG: UvrD-helicase domain-containing protein [bacterium]|nr:UvrD-helicase domain-containing protein [bacterium]